MRYALEASKITKSYDTSNGPLTVLHDMSFRAAKDEFVAFVGPSGCGKSTLFNIITGLIAPDSGGIIVDGQETTGNVSEKIGYVLQKDLLFPWRTVIQNIILGLEVRGTPKREARERAMALLADYKMTGFENQLPGQLSGGMRQRVALMRTMVTDPQIILIDESYKALDYPLKIELEGELLAKVKGSGKTVIFITHDIEEAVTMADRVYVMKARPGEIVEEIRVDLGTDSFSIPERRMSPRFNEYYNRIWQRIGAPQTVTA